jgi:DNA-binding transcriptional LysR family regulator
VRKLPNLNALRAFDAAARQGSFVGAAGELGVSHAAVSRHVRHLEADLGVALFERHARHVVLTGEGRLFARTVAASLSALEIGTGRLRRGVGRSTVVLDVESDLATRWLMPLLTADALDELNVTSISGYAPIRRARCSAMPIWRSPGARRAALASEQSRSSTMAPFPSAHPLSAAQSLR